MPPVVARGVRALAMHRLGLEVGFHGIPDEIFDRLPGAARACDTTSVGGNTTRMKTVRVGRKRVTFYNDVDAHARIVKPLFDQQG